MKKLIKYALVLSQVLLLASCNNLLNFDDGKAYICASVKDLNRKLLPVNVTQNDITKAEITYNITDDADSLKSKEWFSTETKNAIEVMKEDSAFAIQTGTYDFTLSLYVSDSNDPSIYNCTQKGSLLKVPLISGKNDLNFTTIYNTDDDATGNVSVKFAWEEKARVVKARVSLVEFANGNNSAEIEDSVLEYTTFSTETDSTVAEGSTAETLNCITYEKNNLAVGTYWLQVLLYQSETDTDPTVWFDMIKILAGCTTTGENSNAEKITGINTIYNINYDTNGGEWITGYTPIISRNANTGIDIPTEEYITREGYSFGGWIVCDEEGNEEIGQNGDFIYLSEIGIGTNIDYNLKADWIKQISYTVNYLFENADDDLYTANEDLTESGIENQWFTSSTENSQIADLLYTDKNLEKTADHFICTGIDNDSITVTENSVTFNVKYNRETVTYTFNANGGQFNSESSLSMEGIKYGATLSITEPDRNNFTLSNWSVSITVKDTPAAITGTVNELPSTYGIISLTDEEGITTEYDNITTANFTANWEAANSNASIIDVSFNVTDDDISVTNNLENLTDSTIVFTADTGYDSYTWKVDGEDQPAQEPENILTIDASSWATGIYDVSLKASKDGRLYSYTIQINWTRN